MMRLILLSLISSLGLFAQCQLIINPVTGLFDCIGVGGGGATPTGPAGGTLANTYPNPTLAGLSGQGAIPFQGVTAGVTTSDVSNLSWDATNSRFSVGGSTALESIYIGRYTSANIATLWMGVSPVSNSNYVLARSNSMTFLNSSATSQTLAFYQGLSERGRIAATSGNFIIGGNTTDSGFRLDINSSGGAGTFRCYDQTVSTGVTNCVIRAGAGQSSTAMQVYQNNGGSTVASVNSGGDFSLRHIVGSGTAPTIASGFGTSPSITGRDIAGRVTVGSGGTDQTGTITFGAAWSTAPVCMAQNETTQQVVYPVASTTTLTISSTIPFTASDSLLYMCVGY